MQAIRTPTKRNQNSVHNFINDTQSLVSSEKEWICQRVDLAALGHEAEHGWFNGFIEDTLIKVAPRLSMVSIATKDINELTSVFYLKL